MSREPGTEAGRRLVQAITHGVATRWMTDRVREVEAEIRQPYEQALERAGHRQGELLREREALEVALAEARQQGGIDVERLARALCQARHNHWTQPFTEGHLLGEQEEARVVIGILRAALASEPQEPQYTPGGLRYPTLDELNGGPIRTDLPMVRPPASEPQEKPR